MTGNEDSVGDTPQSECDHDNWTKTGVVDENHLSISVIWECTDCPAWTAQPLGTVNHVSWENTPMCGGDDGD